MKRIRCGVVASLVALSLAMTGAQEAKKTDRDQDAVDPELAITPHTIRVQPMDPDEKGHWIAMPGYAELGSPCFSRDGLWIAFDAYKQGYNNSGPEAWIARRDGTGQKKLTNGATPRWSPDGKRLLFMRGSENAAIEEPDIYTIRADGTDEKKLMTGRWPEWSPDGKQIACSRGGLRGGGAKVGAELFICAADGTGAKNIGLGDCPSWSPDGKKIAYCFKDVNTPPEIQVVDIESKETKTLGIGWFRANWIPDGKAVVADGFAGHFMMVRLSVDEPGVLPKPLFSQFEDTASPCVSSDGRYAVFIARRQTKGGGP